jgi:hypothetical protein
MKQTLLLLAVLCGCLILLSGTASAQSGKLAKAQEYVHGPRPHSDNGKVDVRYVGVRKPVRKHSTAAKILIGTGRATVTVVGTAAKISYQTGKFGAKYVVRPVLFHVLPKLILIAL